MTWSEPEVTDALVRILEPGDVAFDVGANVGDHTVTMAKLVGPLGQVLAFEPGANVLPRLYADTERFKQVQIIEHPVSNTDDDVTFWLNADDPGGNALWNPGLWPGGNPKSKASPQTRQMRATTLRAWWSSAVKLVKIDTEGAEQRVIEGMLPHLPPYVIAEIHNFGLLQFGHDQMTLRNLMLRNGMETWGLTIQHPEYIKPENFIHHDRIYNVLFASRENVAKVWR